MTDPKALANELAKNIFEGAIHDGGFWQNEAADIIATSLAAFAEEVRRDALLEGQRMANAYADLSLAADEWGCAHDHPTLLFELHEIADARSSTTKKDS